MCKAEDLLYEAHHEGIRDEVLAESRRLYQDKKKYEHMEFGDRIEIALRNVRENKLQSKLKNESI